MRIIRETAPARKWAGVSKTHSMTKQEILDHYANANKSQQDAITRAARLWLSARGIGVGRDSLRHWRSGPTPRSPLALKYRQAYEAAIKQLSSARHRQPVPQIIPGSNQQNDFKK